MSEESTPWPDEMDESCGRHGGDPKRQHLEEAIRLLKSQIAAGLLQMRQVHAILTEFGGDAASIKMALEMIELYEQDLARCDLLLQLSRHPQLLEEPR